MASGKLQFGLCCAQRAFFVKNYQQLHESERRTREQSYKLEQKAKANRIQKVEVRQSESDRLPRVS